MTSADVRTRLLALGLYALAFAMAAHAGPRTPSHLAPSPCPVLDPLADLGARLQWWPIDVLIGLATGLLIANAATR